ncbi:(Fe-S)-binding protein, partial [Candidatus Fermentibacteria bacterium]|nr:(Fe-S)-binding protein [Candidatus Fermentibacteria bacterium]
LLPSVNPPPAIPFLHRVFLAPTPRSATMLAVSLAQRILRPTVHLMHKDFTTRALSSYAALPPMEWRRYATHDHRLPGMTPDLRIIGDEKALVYEGTVVVRFKGCVGNIGQAEASVHEDRFFASMGMAFLDFVPDLCCGFPFLASGDRSSARTSRERLWERIHAAARSACEVLNTEKVVVMSSCPTCQESLRRAHLEQGAPPHLCIADPAQYARERAKIIHRPTTRRVGLKVPCHAIPEATSSQEALLREHGFTPVLLPQCCGMAGTGRLRHPEVGLVLAERLAAAIRDAGVDMVVSGCPSCRDGMQLQATIDGAPLRVDDIYGLLVEAS